MKNITKAVSVITATSILIQSICCPLNSWASVTGPAQPEFSSFNSVSADGMLNTFTGDLNYSIPTLEILGPDGGGYALSLSYSSNIGAEAEASWVGCGWTLSPGAIVRNKQGFPDDVDAGSVTYYNKMKKNWTVSGSTNGSVGVRAFGVASYSIGSNKAISYNNYKGLSTFSLPYVSYQLGMKTTTISLGENAGNGIYSFSHESPISFYYKIASSIAQRTGLSNSIRYKIADSKLSEFAISYAKSSIHRQLSSGGSMSSSSYAAYTLHNKSVPTPTAEYKQGGVGSVRVSLGGYSAPTPLPIGFGASISGSYNWQSTIDAKAYTYYGYLYSHNAGEEDMMDYHVERPDNLNPHDEILATPFSSPDIFNVVGEGLSGGMRLFSSNIGEFHPRKVSNESPITEVGLHVNLGPLNFGGSIPPVTVGAYKTSVSSWDDKGTNDKYNFSDAGDEAYFFRFLGDMGGDVLMSTSDWAENASMSGNNNDGYVPLVPSSCQDKVNKGATVGRSSHIGYHTNTDMNKKDSNNKPYKRYSQRSDIEDLVNRSESDGIGEFAITNKQGNRYVYAFPVYTKNETIVSLSVSENDKVGNYLAYKDISNSDNYDTKLGQKISDKYAAMHLLTEITSPNYVDRTMDGPTPDDFGGWTKFNYTKEYGDNGNSTSWFHWRAPWKGLIYNSGQLSNPNDDMGSYSSGDKEICYLESIETATHIAKFTLSDRKDGLEAESDYDAAKGGTMTLTDNKKLKKLDKITLYAKDKDGNPSTVISRTYFEYNYSLSLNQPNTIGVGSQSGKLTLKKVWFEYGDVRNAKISPYVFYYEYPKTTGTNAVNYPLKPKYEKNEVTGEWEKTINDEYALLENYADVNGDGISDLNENPSYDEANIDAWGNYQANGQDRARDLKNWVDQNPSASFDPAAWTLKRIKLPTEGEIHIQYEQKKYSYVQDRRASVMVPLSGLQSIIYDTPNDERTSGNYGTHYYLNLNEIGANNDADKAAIIDWIKKVYIDGCNGRDPEKMYFKFKYDIEGVSTDCEEYQWEYITGYANVMNVGIETGITSGHVGELYVQLGNPRTEASATGDNDDFNSPLFLSDLEAEANITDGGFSSPCDACREYFKANKGLDIGQACGESALVGSEDNDAEKFVLQMVDILTGSYDDNSSKACKEMNPLQSYLRIPVPSSKKGGGVRVKRLLRYDNGLEKSGDDAELYGNEYVYETIDGECSGVAANEPGAIREENSLTTYLKKRSELSAEEVLVAGEDKSQFEGPVGETVLPGASIGYSRVITKNIHTGATNPGFSTSEFYTAKDYPFDRTTKDGYSGVSYTELDKKVDNPDPNFGLLTNKTYYASWSTQGFKFVINNMHGQAKKVTLYDGDYNNLNDIDQITELSSTAYHYFEPGELIPVMNSHYDYGLSPLGKEVEVVTESKKITETDISSTVTGEAGIGIFGIYTIPYAFATYFTTKDETYLHTHVTNKIIYCPSVIKSVTNYKDGVYSTLLNKYFDPLSGDPVVQEKSGVFDQQVLANLETHQGKYISFNYPASMYYADMGQKAGCEGLTIGEISKDEVTLKFTSTSFEDPTYSDHPFYITFSGDDYCAELEKLSPGDLIAINTSSTYPTIAQIKNIQENKVQVIENSNYPFPFVVFGTKDCSIEVLQSNRANLLAVSAGNIVLYGSFEAPDGLLRNYDESNREALADYLNASIDGSAPAKPEELANISVVSPTSGNCVQCEEYDQSTVDKALEISEALKNIIGADDFNMEDYQSILDFGVENTMQFDYVMEYIDQIEAYMDMASTDNCLICDATSEFWQADNFYNTMATSYEGFAEETYFNATSARSYLNNVISNETLFSTNFVTNSTYSMRVNNLKIIR